MANLRGTTQSRVLFHQNYDGNGFTTNDSLAKMRLTSPETINPVITHLMGKESDAFPMTFLTEGQLKGSRSISVEDIEYKFPVMGRLKKSDIIMGHEYAADTEGLGKGGAPVYITMKTNWIKQQHTVHTQNGVQMRTQGRPVVVSTGFKYEFQLIYSNDQESIPMSEITAGLKLSMVGGANVSESYSSGNESNKQSPAMVKNQIGVIRKSYEISGNVHNRTVEFQFNLNGKATRLWMPQEEYQHELQFKIACEENLWFSKYNRNNKGEVTTKDPETGLTIPYGAGIDDQILNRDTYGVLTLNKLSNTIGDVFYGTSDGLNSMELILYTGTGGMRELDAAIKKDITNLNGWSSVVADKMVQGNDPNKLIYGGYFNQYRHIDGHILTVKKLNLLDFGGRAENAPLHPKSGLPLTSYEMYFIDQSMYEGERNVQMVHQKGRSFIRGLEQGMNLYNNPGTLKEYMGYKGNDITVSTGQDKSAVHFLKTLGISIRKSTHCFKLSCDLS